MLKRSHSFKYICLAIFFVVLFVVLIVIELLCDSSIEKSELLRYEIIKSVSVALVVTGLIGLLTKYISEDILRIQKNDKKLREYGITGLGTGKLSYQDTIDMFGDGISHSFPTQLDFLFLTGNSFISVFKEKIIRALAEGCNIRLLIVRPVVDGEINSYLKHYSAICEETDAGLAYEVYDEVLPLISEIRSEAAKINPESSGAIEVRSYIDEFRNNQRYATYIIRGEKEIRCWLNIQSTIKSAINLSLLLRGVVDKSEMYNDELGDKNLMFASFLSFEKLWDLYPNSCPKPEEADLFDYRKNR